MVQERGMFEHSPGQVSHLSSCQFCEGARKFRSDILKGLANRPIEVFDLKNVTAVQFMDKNGRNGLPEVRELLKNENFLLGDNPAGGLHTERLYRNECIVKVSHQYCININGALTLCRSFFASMLARKPLLRARAPGWLTKLMGVNTSQSLSHLSNLHWPLLW
jgi:hypothetical protein